MFPALYRAYFVGQFLLHNNLRISVAFNSQVVPFLPHAFRLAGFFFFFCLGLALGYELFSVLLESVAHSLAISGVSQTIQAHFSLCFSHVCFISLTTSCGQAHHHSGREINFTYCKVLQGDMLEGVNDELKTVIESAIFAFDA